MINPNAIKKTKMTKAEIIDHQHPCPDLSQYDFNELLCVTYRYSIMLDSVVITSVRRAPKRKVKKEHLTLVWSA